MTFIDVIKHILPYNSAKERLINYCIFQNLKISCSLRRYAQIIPHVSQSAQKLHYITLYYITLVWYFATCTVYITLHYYGILQLALYIYIQCKLQNTIVM